MSEESPLTCWLCGRPFEERIQWHHPVPKSKKGRATVPVHPICHKTIHVHFTNAQIMLDSNLLWSAIHWALYGDQPSVALRSGRQRSLLSPWNLDLMLSGVTVTDVPQYIRGSAGAYNLQVSVPQ